MGNSALKYENPSVKTNPSVKRPKLYKTDITLLGKMLPIISFFILWELVTRLNSIFELTNPLFFPPPTVILERAWELTQSGLLLSSLGSSTIRILLGFLIGMIFAVALALVMGRVKIVEQWLTPIINMIGPIPALALLPLFIIWFGIGEVPKVFLIAWTSFFPILTNMVVGLNSVNSNLIRSALSLGASNHQIYKKVIIPSTLPSLLAGCQISLGLGFSALVVSEMMGTTSGLGFMIVDARNYFKITDMYVAIILIGIEYSLFSLLFKKIDRQFLSWKNDGFHKAVEK